MSFFTKQSQEVLCFQSTRDRGSAVLSWEPAGCGQPRPSSEPVLLIRFQFLFMLPFLHEGFESAPAFFHVARTRCRDRRQSPIAKNRGALLTFALCSPIMEVCANGCHARFGFNLYPSVAPTHAAVVVGIGLEWNRVPSPRFVHPGCTATTSRIQVGEMLLHEGAEAYKREGRGISSCSA
jgi:hypothetical protein